MIFAFAGLVLGVLLTRRMSSANKNTKLEHEVLEALSEKLASQEKQLTSLLDERLQRNSDAVQQSLSKASTETLTTLGDLRERLGQITTHQKNISDLSSSVTQLHQVLTNNQKQGVFGELQLEEIVNEALPGQNYEFQYSLSNGKRPDLLLKLPSPPGSICVDSKFPIQSYRDICDASNGGEAASARGRFKTAVKKHITDIASKYILPGETSDFALMFLPSEAIFVEIQSNHPDLVRESQNSRVYVVSPTTMMATVTAIRGIVRDAELNNQANQVRESLLKIGKDIDKLDENARKLESHFNMIQNDVAAVVRGMHNVKSRIDFVGDVNLGTSEHDSDSESPN